MWGSRVSPEVEVSGGKPGGYVNGGIYCKQLFGEVFIPSSVVTFDVLRDHRLEQSVCPFGALHRCRMLFCSKKLLNC